MSRGLPIVMSAPSGCGKGTILEQIFKDESFYRSVSATTRLPRCNEKNDIDYHFISKEEFEEMIKNDGVLEYACYCGNYYGTPRKETEEKLSEGKNVIFEVDVRGAMQIKEIYPEAVLVFVVPPSIDELRRRLLKRGTESADVIEERISQVEREIKEACKYDYIIVNDELEKAVEDFKVVIKASLMKPQYSEYLIREVLENA